MDPLLLKNRSTLMQRLHSPFKCLFIFTITSKFINRLPAKRAPSYWVPHSQKSLVLDVCWCASSDPAQKHSVQTLEEKGGLGKKIGLLSGKKNSISGAEKSKVFRFFFFSSFSFFYLLFFTICVNCHQAANTSVTKGKEFRESIGWGLFK